MPFNINDFSSHIKQSGYLKRNNYDIIVSQPPNLLGFIIGGNEEIISTDVTRMMTFRVNNVRTPQVSLNTTNIRRYGVGPVQKYAYTSQFNEIIFTITCDEKGTIWHFWHNWLRSVFDSTGGSDQLTGNFNTFPTYYSRFRDEYSSTVQLNLYDQIAQDEKTGTLRFDMFETYPVNIMETPLSWSDTRLLELTIVLNFKDFTIVGSDVERFEEFGFF